MRRRAVVVGARAVHEPLAVGRREEEIALVGVEEELRDLVGDRERLGEPALAGAGAVQVEERGEERRGVVEERALLRAAVGVDAQETAFGVAELREHELRRRRRRRRAARRRR